MWNCRQCERPTTDVYWYDPWEEKTIPRKENPYCSRCYEFAIVRSIRRDNFSPQPREIERQPMSKYEKGKLK